MYKQKFVHKTKIQIRRAADYMMNSKILLIANYWQPYNHPGTFRWWNFSKYIKFDVLTASNPKGAFEDETIKNINRNQRIFSHRLFSNIAFSHGLCLSFYAWNMRKDYDMFVFTSPPETLIFGAWLLQSLGYKVLLDMRDAPKRPLQPIKILVPIYNYVYSKIKNVVVAWQLIDRSKKVIHHGHDNLILKSDTIKVFDKRYNHKEFNQKLSEGYIPKINGKYQTYVRSSLINVIHLWGDKINLSGLHKELQEIKPNSWKCQANKMQQIIGSIK